MLTNEERERLAESKNDIEQRAICWDDLVWLADMVKRLDAECKQLHDDNNRLADLRRRTRHCRDCRFYEMCEDANVGYWCSEWEALEPKEGEAHADD